jgi:tetratricopeptide (TPR) repeat protein
MTSTDMEYIEKVDEYYKLKSAYETAIDKYKKSILNNKQTSWRDKRTEYEQIKPKCVNCKRPVGSKFSVKHNADADVRYLVAICGDVINPCPLNISINLGYFDNYSETITDIENIIKTDKNRIIKYKNELLFGYITTQEALEKFDNIKTNVSEYSKILARYLEEYNNIIDNSEEKTNLQLKLTETFVYINKIKESIERFNSTNDNHIIKDVVELYTNSLMPKLKEIMKLKYKYCRVEKLDDNCYHLIQRKYTASDVEFALAEPSINSFVVGMAKPPKLKTKPKTKKNVIAPKNKTAKRIVVVEDSSSDENAGEEKEKEEGIRKLDSVGEPEPTAQIPEPISNEPVFNEDGSVKWNNPTYQQLWNNLHPAYKTALLKDRPWLQDVMDKCVESRQNKQPCAFFLPKQTIIPPTLLPDGNYEFGSPSVNDYFNKKPELFKNALLTMYAEESDMSSPLINGVRPKKIGGPKNYSMFKSALESSMEKDFGITEKRGFL